MNEEEYRLFQTLNERVTDLSKSYRVLNDNHAQLRLEFVEFKSKADMAIAIMKWFISPITGLTLLLRILELMGVIK